MCKGKWVVPRYKRSSHYRISHGCKHEYDINKNSWPIMKFQEPRCILLFYFLFHFLFLLFFQFSPFLFLNSSSSFLAPRILSPHVLHMGEDSMTSVLLSLHFQKSYWAIMRRCLIMKTNEWRRGTFSSTRYIIALINPSSSTSWTATPISLPRPIPPTHRQIGSPFLHLAGQIGVVWGQVIRPSWGGGEGSPWLPPASPQNEKSMTMWKETHD